MPIHTITNALTGMLDMSPLRDLLERPLTLKAYESREITEETFTHDIVQRVLKTGWLKENEPSPSLEPEPEAPTPDDLGLAEEVVSSDLDDLVVIDVSDETPEDAQPPPITDVESSTMPVETPIITEAPMPAPSSNASSTPTNKSNKRR